jgi:hypothetical protein
VSVVEATPAGATDDTLGVAARFRQWSTAAHGTAYACRSKDDAFGVRLAQARAEVYALAAEMIADGARNTVSPDRLAGRFADLELDHHVAIQFGAVPLALLDDMFLEHARARAWGLCACTVNPAHVCVEQPW